MNLPRQGTVSSTMTTLLVRLGAGLGLLTIVTSASAAPPKNPPPRPDPDRCASPFDCGALSARLAGREDDYPGAFRAIRRGCDIETRRPNPGDAKFACEQYAELLVSAGPSRGGDPPRGIAMLEAMCKERPVATSTSTSPCSTLAREYDHPPPRSGLPRRADKALALRRAACDRGDSLACDAVGDTYRKGAPGVATDLAAARAAYDKGCSGTDSYAAGVCGALASLLVEGKLGAPPDPVAARPYLERSCAHGYRCDLLVDLLLREGKDAEAVRVLERPTSFFGRKAEIADRYCREGHRVMCGRGGASAGR